MDYRANNLILSLNTKQKNFRNLCNYITVSMKLSTNWLEIIFYSKYMFPNGSILSLQMFLLSTSPVIYICSKNSSKIMNF